jgi:hypothetical protein
MSMNVGRHASNAMAKQLAHIVFTTMNTYVMYCTRFLLSVKADQGADTYSEHKYVYKSI